MGSPTREVWPEVWEINEPIFQSVVTGGETVYREDLSVLIARNDCMETAYFTLAYSPICIEDNQIGGVLGVLLETTQRVLLEQKLKQANEIFKVKIAEQKRVEAELRDSEHLYHELFKSATDTNKELAFQNEEKEKRASELVIANKAFQQAQKMESVGRLAGGVAHDFNNMLGVIIGHSEMALDQLDPAHPLHADLMAIRKAAQRSTDLTRQLLAFARKQSAEPKVLDLNKTVAGMLNMLQRLIGEDIILNWHPAENVWPVKIDPSQIDQILANLVVNARDERS